MESQNKNLTASLARNSRFMKRSEDFRERFQKRYSSFEEFVERYEIFAENMKFIGEHNMDFTQNFTLGMNQFTDMTNEELRERKNGLLRFGSDCVDAVKALNSNMDEYIVKSSMLFVMRNGITPLCVFHYN